ncbi:MAG: hypothetical protein SGILL_006745 [Bacillariaceae sp.]
MLEDVWARFPTTGINKVNFEWITNPDINYGLHHLDLGMDNVSEEDMKIMEEKNMKIGTKSLGLTYDNHHTSVMFNRSMCKQSEKHLGFLQGCHDSIQLQCPEYRMEETSDFMRVNCVAGAKTKEHTDTMRGFTRSFIAIEKGSSFQLRVRMFPHFRSSVVMYNNQFYIPHELSDKEICLIGLKEGRPHFFIGPQAIMEKLESFGRLVNHVVVGIKKGKLQVIKTKYEVIPTPKYLPLISFEDAVMEASLNSQKKPHGRGKYKYIGYKDQWQEFWGWKHAHEWVPGTDHLCRRINIFYRAMREVAPSAFTRTSHSTGQPLNWSPLELTE